ncbi:MAG: RIP metalloprotease RseP, partial [Candidatus Omnitrophica bacterium]|nr:RIP metalloprotease RseP [Candidatus Omnitrophota bacterium]
MRDKPKGLVMRGALVFIFVLSVLVVAHEFGHFIVARLVGIRVEKFSIGFGPVLLRRKFWGTEFCFSLYPFGGFVKLAGESPEESEGREWEFNSKPLFQRFLVIVAGPLMNAVLAFLLFSVVFLGGQPTLTGKIGKVLDGAPAKTAGLAEGDTVLRINGKDVRYWEDILEEVRRGGGKEMIFQVRRGSGDLEVPVAPVAKEARDIFGKRNRIAFVGIAPSSEMVYVKSDLPRALALAAGRVWTLTVMILMSLGLMVTGALSFKDSMTGPIGIFFMTREAAQMGAAYLFYFMGSLSVSLFVLNLLPIPVLDGGHLLFMLIEKIKGSPLKESTKERMTQG